MTLAIAISVLLVTIIGAIIYGRRTTRRQSVEEWAIGGRRFGTLIFWFVNAGEIYTTFAVLGVSGFAWAYGAPAYISFTSVSLASALGYWLLPRIWRAGREHGLMTQADFFTAHYRSRALGVLAAIAGLVAMVIYVQIQITALSLIIGLTTGLQLSPLANATLAAAIMLAFVYLAGLRSAAFAAGVKDVLMVLLVVALAFAAVHKLGATSMIDVFRMAGERHPGIGSFPGLKPEAGLTTTWFMTSAVNIALSTWVFPHMFQLAYSASGERATRLNAVWQPLYSLSYFMIIMLGIAALLAGTAPAGDQSNAALLTFVAEKFPAWMVGLLAGTACLLALVPGSVLLLTCGTIFTRNIVAPLKPGMSDRATLLVARVSMIGFAGIALYLAAGQNDSIIRVGLFAYSAIGMLAPGVILAFTWRGANAAGVIAGIVAGYAALLHPVALGWWQALLPTCEPGLPAFLVNFAVAVGVSLLVGRVRGTTAEPSPMPAA